MKNRIDAIYARQSVDRKDSISIESQIEFCKYELRGGNHKDYQDVVFPGKHIFNIHNKNDTFTVEGGHADLRHYIPALARRSRCFPRKLENLQAVLAVFVRAHNRFGLRKHICRSRHPGTSIPFSLFNSL